MISETALAEALAEALEGPGLSPSSSFHVLLRLAAPRLREALCAPTLATAAADRRDLSRRVLALLDDDADGALADLEAAAGAGE